MNRAKKSRYGTAARSATSDAFVAAIETAEHLQLMPGLSALKKGEGKDRIHQGTGKLLGSVRIDEDCRPGWPNDPRWDYVVGRGPSDKPHAHFVEVHSAHTGGVNEVEKKLTWLLDYLEREPQAELRRLSCSYHWVASGRVDIPKHTAQYKRLKMRPLSLLQGQKPTERLALP